MNFPGRHAPRPPRLTFLFIFLPDQWGIASSTPDEYDILVVTRVLGRGRVLITKISYCDITGFYSMTTHLCGLRSFVAVIYKHMF